MDYRPRYSSLEGEEYCHRRAAEYGEYQNRQGEQMYSNSRNSAHGSHHHNNSHHGHHYRQPKDHGYDHGYQHEHEHKHAMQAPLDSDHSTEPCSKKVPTTESSERAFMMSVRNYSQARENSVQELEVDYGT